MSYLRQPEQFDYQRNCSNAERWQTWVRKFNMFLLASNITDEAQQLNTFLYVVGEDVSEIYDALGQNKTKAVDAIKVITDHFTPAPRKDSAILAFRKLKQIQGETIDAFTSRLIIEARKNSLANAEDHIRLQLIAGAISNKIRIKSEAEDISLNDLIIYARTVESLHDHHAQQPHSLDDIKQEQVNQVYKHNNHRQYHNNNHQNHNQHKQSTHNHNHSNKNPSNTCGTCGYEYPHKNSCPAKGKKCNNCGRLNHFTKCCRSKPQNTSNSNKPKHFHKANFITTNNEDSSGDEKQSDQQTHMLQIEKESPNKFESAQEVYNAYAITNKKHMKCPRVDVWIGNNKINMGPDTQSSINAISIGTFDQLNPKPKLEANESIVYSYDSKKPMKSIGKFEIQISVNNKSITAIIMVFENVLDNL
jgi:hypothetical protein